MPQYLVAAEYVIISLLAAVYLALVMLEELLDIRHQTVTTSISVCI